MGRLYIVRHGQASLLSDDYDRLSPLGAAQARPTAQVLNDPGLTKFLSAVVKDLLGAVGRSVVVTGPEQPAEVHALVHRINAVLGNVGRTVFYTEEPLASQATGPEALSIFSPARRAIFRIVSPSLA